MTPTSPHAAPSPSSPVRALRPLGSVEHVHFVGIGGVGMCGLAEVLLAQGLTVSGCDLATSERTSRLEGLGARISGEHDASHVHTADAVVVSAAVDIDSPELVQAHALGLPVVRRAELLAELMRLRRGVAIAGTHGKTTTTCLVDHALRGCGLDPTVVAGGRSRALGAHSRLGSDPLMVCEADEFDRAFLTLSPVWAVITNVEAEHLECYGTVSELETAFVEFANSVPFYGAVIACIDDPGVRRLLPRLERRCVTYGLSATATVRAEGVTLSSDGATFEVLECDESQGTVRLPIHGAHNVRNALAAIALVRELGLPAQGAYGALGTFRGVARRFEVRGHREGVTVVDDYAHHPTEVAAALSAARGAFPGRRLVAVFQPHLYSRTRTLAGEFGEALLDADVAVVLPVYPAREAPLPGVDAGMVVQAALDNGHRHVLESPSVAAASSVLDGCVLTGDVVLTLGAGDVFRVADDWLGGAP